MAVRIRQVKSIEVSGLGIFSLLRIMAHWMRIALQDGAAAFGEGYGTVILRRRGEYRGYLTPGQLKRARGSLKAAVIADRVQRGDRVWDEVRAFQQRHLYCHCPLFDGERFEGIAYEDGYIRQNLYVIKRCEIWKGINNTNFWERCEDKVFICDNKDELYEALQELGTWVMSAPNGGAERGELCSVYDDSFVTYMTRISWEEDVKATNRLLRKLMDGGIRVVIAQTPSINQIDNTTPDENYRKDKIVDEGSQDKEAIRQLKLVYGDDYEDLCLGRMREKIAVYENMELKRAALLDVTSDVLNIVDGRRVVPNAPADAPNRVYCFGPCTMLGAFVRDGDTIPALLQDWINCDFAGQYRVVNLGCPGSVYLYYRRLKETTFRKGDVCVILYSDVGKLQRIPNPKYVDLLEPMRVRKGNVWFDKPAHVNAAGARICAEALWRDGLQPLLNEVPDSDGAVVQQGQYFISDNPAWSAWKKKLLERRIENLPEHASVGAIVMNCNPFTLGHQWLIETASRQVDALYVFVVEEDKSYFSFADRMEMVRRGVAAYPNVRVLPSGRFCLSVDTMPEYFNKEAQQEITVNAGNDLELFAMEIAPVLHITKRFVGEEPLDNVTRQYNEAMQRILPQYGIELVCIERKQADGEPISASRARQAIKVGDYAALNRLLPVTTIEYLRICKKLIGYER